MSPTRRDVLVLRALGLGDALTGVAALRGVRRAWPGCRLWLAAPPGVGGLLRGAGVVDEVVPAEGLDGPLPWGRHGHVAVDLHGRGPQSHRLLDATGPERLVAFAVDGFPDGPAWDPGEHEVDRWCRLVRSAGGACDRQDLRLPWPLGTVRSGEVLVHPGAAAPSRRWPAACWAELVRRLVDRGHRVALTGGPQERELCDRVRGGRSDVANLAGRLDLEALVRRVAGARLLVCGDTGVAHVATAVGTPSVLLFGPTPPAAWGPALDAELHTVLWRGDGDRPGDPHGDALDPALGAVTVDQVQEAVQAQLAR